MVAGGGVDRAVAEQGYDTFQLLKELDIPYDELLEPQSPGEKCRKPRVLPGFT